jgi:hypothetical protein
MYLIFNQALVARTSSDVTVFRLEFDDEEKKWGWSLKEVLDIRGFVYFIRGNVRF